MANVDNPHGFLSLGRNIYGGASRTIITSKLVGYGTALFIGDAVCKVTAGTKKWPVVSANITPGTTPVLGVNLIYGAASTATDHLLIPSTGEVFECQEDNDGSAVDAATTGIPATAINDNANVILGAGSATTLRSGHELDRSTLNSTATLDLHILGLLDAPDNAFGSWARVEVIFNNAANEQQTAGVA